MKRRHVFVAVLLAAIVGLSPIIAVAVDDVVPAEYHGGFYHLKWDWSVDSEGDDSARTTAPVFGVIYRAWTTSVEGTANTFTITVKEYVDSETGSTDIADGGISTNAHALTAHSFWPGTEIPVGSALQFDMSGVSASTETGGVGTLELVIGPPDFGN